MIVDGNLSTFGRILETNIMMSKLSGYSAKELKLTNYEIIMNAIVKKHHGRIV